jgi:predicted DsbA family dithiol-disulfide isomerase
LLHLADVEGEPGQQAALKKALLAACHTRSEAMGDHAVLLACAKQAGLDPDRAAAVLASDEFTAEVRDRQAFYTRQGIHSVPAVIINDRHLISGGQPAAVFEQALRQIAAS